MVDPPRAQGPVIDLEKGVELVAAKDWHPHFDIIDDAEIAAGQRERPIRYTILLLLVKAGCAIQNSKRSAMANDSSI